MAHFSKSLWRLHNHVMWYKKTYKTALSKSTSTAQQRYNITTNCHQVSAEARESRRMKTSTTMANHDPRMNRTNPKYRKLLGIVGTWCTPCDSCNCLLIALCVLGIVCSCFVCFLSVCYCLVLMLVLVLVFGISASKPVWQIKPRIRNLSRVCFPCTYLWHLE
jgi:hypothetical protein